MSTNNQKPVQGQVYTLRQIEEDLFLRDSAFLRFWFAPPNNLEASEEAQVIQTSHCTTEQMLNIPEFADSLWRYQGETDEWIPLFMYAGDQPITELVTMEPDFYEASNWWVTPKTLHREQYVTDCEYKDIVYPDGFQYTSFDWRLPNNQRPADEWQFAFVWNCAVYASRNKPHIDFHPESGIEMWDIPEATTSDDLLLISLLRYGDPAIHNWKNTLVGRGANNEVVKIEAQSATCTKTA